MNNTSKMSRLLSEMRRQMNGAVAESMEQRGLTYPLNYGVSLPTLRDIARGYAPDDDFARFLYRQQVRELQLAAFVIAEPAKIVDEEDLEFWSGGIKNVEMAENFASTLLFAGDIAERTVMRWLENDNTPALLQYSALVCLSKLAVSGKVERRKASDMAKRYSDSPSGMLRMAADNVETVCMI